MFEAATRDYASAFIPAPDGDGYLYYPRPMFGRTPEGQCPVRLSKAEVETYISDCAHRIRVAVGVSFVFLIAALTLMHYLPESMPDWTIVVYALGTVAGFVGLLLVGVLRALNRRNLDLAGRQVVAPDPLRPGA